MSIQKNIFVLDQLEASQTLAHLIGSQLANNQRVLWFISGGSSLPIASDTAKMLNNDGNLRVLLVDDVFGLKDKSKSNWAQLLALDFALADLLIPISPKESVGSTGKAYAKVIEKELERSDFLIGQFGLGKGFHTGGIQPHSLAARENKELAIGYDDNSVQRITITPNLIKQLDVAFINSFGDEKRPLVQHFLKSNASVTDEPTQALKQAMKCYLYSDVVPD